MLISALAEEAPGREDDDEEEEEEDDAAAPAGSAAAAAASFAAANSESGADDSLAMVALIQLLASPLLDHALDIFARLSRLFLACPAQLFLFS